MRRSASRGLVILVAALTTPWCAMSQAAEDVKPSGRKPIAGILYNEDDSHRFVLDPTGKMTPATLDGLVDELAGAHVTTMLICCCAKKTNFPSTSWEPHCDGFDPTKGNDQPYFGDTTPEARKGLRKWAENLRKMLDAGVDPTGRMLARCRQRGISPWVSIRMNDSHDAPLTRSPLHSRFYREHPEYLTYRKRMSSWHDRCLNFNLQPVRDHAMALIKEVCDRFDMDGLELDWNRFCGHFRDDEMAEGGKALTEWMADVRKVVREAEKKWKHPITLAARVPARPDVSVHRGLDAITWAKRGLIDHLIVAPFFTTTDFDIPIERWIELLKGTGVGVTAGLEIRIQPHPGAPVVPNTPERRRGAAMAHLARGSQGIYVFNYFDVGKKYPFLLNEMNSVEAMKGKDRSYVVTYVDVNIPGKPIPPALPKKLAPGGQSEFRLYIGPKPIAGARGEIQLTLTGDGSQCTVLVNDQPTQAASKPGLYTFPRDAFCEGYNTVRVKNAGTGAVTVGGVELSVRFPSK